MPHYKFRYGNLCLLIINIVGLVDETTGPTTLPRRRRKMNRSELIPWVVLFVLVPAAQLALTPRLCAIASVVVATLLVFVAIPAMGLFGGVKRCVDLFGYGFQVVGPHARLIAAFMVNIMPFRYLPNERLVGKHMGSHKVRVGLSELSISRTAERRYPLPATSSSVRFILFGKAVYCASFLHLSVILNATISACSRIVSVLSYFKAGIKVPKAAINTLLKGKRSISVFFIDETDRKPLASCRLVHRNLLDCLHYFFGFFHKTKPIRAQVLNRAVDTPTPSRGLENSWSSTLSRLVQSRADILPIFRLIAT